MFGKIEAEDLVSFFDRLLRKNYDNVIRFVRHVSMHGDIEIPGMFPPQNCRDADGFILNGDGFL